MKAEPGEKYKADFHKAEQQWVNERSGLEVSFRETVRKLGNRLFSDENLETPVQNDTRGNLWHNSPANRGKTL